MNKKEFDAFFKNYSQNVDNADRQNFWKLSDEIIFAILKNHFSGENLDSEKLILDAGGGSAKWSIKLSEEFNNKFIVYDLSQDMLDKAKQNIYNANKDNKISLVCGDMCNMERIKTNSIDHIISIYSPLSFIYDQDKALKELYRILKPNGSLFIMSHSYFNAINSKINNYFAEHKELEKLSSQFRVKWNDYVPELVVHSKESLEKSLINVGFKVFKTYGIPIFIQPRDEDFDSTNTKISKISSYLSDGTIFKTILDLEMRYNSEPTLVNRGVNIFSHVKK